MGNFAAPTAIYPAQDGRQGVAPSTPAHALSGRSAAANHRAFASRTECRSLEGRGHRSRGAGEGAGGGTTMGRVLDEEENLITSGQEEGPITVRNNESLTDKTIFGNTCLKSTVTTVSMYSYTPQYRMSRDQQISSVIGGFLLLPI